NNRSRTDTDRLFVTDSKYTGSSRNDPTERGWYIGRIGTGNPYPEHYQTTVNQVAEENRTGYLPPLKTKIDNIGTYDYIFVGFPTWGMQLPPPMKSFLNEYDLSGKVIIPFNT